MIKASLFHGSKKSGLLTLNAAASHNTIAFGPAIYCTSDRLVAEAQSGAIVVYQVEVEGPAQGVIEFDRPLSEASGKAQAAVTSFLRRYKMLSLLDHNDDRVDFLQDRVADQLVKRGASYPGKALFNRILAEEGVWLMRGEMHGMAKSGLMDRGTQWAILDDRHISIVQESSLSYRHVI